MTQYTKVTHIVAGGIAAVGAFLSTPAGEALVKQYPHVSAVIVSVVTLILLYHKPDEQK